MRNISLPNKELRLLANQLQNFNQGFTADQIRILDKITSQFELILKPFTDGLTQIYNTIPTETTPEIKEKQEKEKQEKLEKYVETEGSKNVVLSLEDAHFDFVKSIWNRISTFNGQKEAREAIIKIDDALKLAEVKDKTFIN